MFNLSKGATRVICGELNTRYQAIDRLIIRPSSYYLLYERIKRRYRLIDPLVVPVRNVNQIKGQGYV